MGRSEGKASDISFLTRIADLGRFVVSGNVPEWFGAGAPVSPVAPREAVEGRKYDFQTALNMVYTPKAADGASVDFPALRALADSYGLLRTVIETRKDQVGKFKWQFVDSTTGKESPASKAVAERFKRPDGDNEFHSWLRVLLEDLFVVDAPCAWFDPETLRIYPMDGSTLKIVLDNKGRRIGYQQILKGVPAVNYSPEQIVYKPRNVRSHKAYGFSPVEQIIQTVNIGLRRELQQLEFFRSGSIPDMLIACPESWNPDQVIQMQQYWDAVLMGNIAARSQARFISGGMKPELFKSDAMLKQEFDEWLARIVCYAFSVSPEPFVAQVNRATAETSRNSALSDGLLPVLSWCKSFIDCIVSDYLKVPGVEFAWDMSASVDSTEEAKLTIELVKAGVVTKDEARDRIGLPALTDDQKKEMQPPAKVDPKADPKKVQPVEKMEKASPVTDATPDEEAFARELHRALQAASVTAIDIAEMALLENMEIADPLSQAEKLRIIRRLARFLAKPYEAGFSFGSTKVPSGAVSPISGARWAKERAATLVGMRITDDGEIIVNPDAKWQISDMMRDAIRQNVTEAMEEGWNVIELSDKLQADRAFSWQRANNIARTETAFAQEAGSMDYYRKAGVKMKEWSTAGGDTCPRCVANEKQGAIPLEAAFQDGSSHAPSHPSCRCTVLPVVEV